MSDGDVIISVENLSKKYRLGEIGANSLREAAELLWFRLRGRNPVVEMSRVGEYGGKGGHGSSCDMVDSGRAVLGSSSSTRELWALKDVSFEVKRGEVLGIIGGNGAGKSTLLKILSRITEPTMGRAVMRGRVGSLLEVGTGFHPELSGRDNIFLNGAIHGMRRKEIAAKFDEIVAFAEVERFIDTPVKRYSSGMYVRLAFAVAAHLDPEILIVDEVLAVGDASFQRKCLGKMKEVAAKEGRTVLFVSHNMAAIASLCVSVLWLDSRVVMKESDSACVIDAYLNSQVQTSKVALERRPDRIGDGRVKFVGFEAVGAAGSISTGGQVTFIFRYRMNDAISRLQDVTIGFCVNAPEGGYLLVFASEEVDLYFDLTEKDGEIKCVVPVFPLAGGMYGINLYAASRGTILDNVVNAAFITVEDSGFYGQGKRRHHLHPRYVTPHQWSAEQQIQR